MNTEPRVHPLIGRPHSIGVALVITGIVLLRPWSHSEPAAPAVPVAFPEAGMFDPQAEARLLDLVNHTRSRAGIRPLVMTHALQAVARAHSQDGIGIVFKEQRGLIITEDFSA